MKAIGILGCWVGAWLTASAQGVILPVRSEFDPQTLQPFPLASSPAQIVAQTLRIRQHPDGSLQITDEYRLKNPTAKTLTLRFIVPFSLEALFPEPPVSLDGALATRWRYWRHEDIERLQSERAPSRVLSSSVGDPFEKAWSQWSAPLRDTRQLLFPGGKLRAWQQCPSVHGNIEPFELSVLEASVSLRPRSIHTLVLRYRLTPVQFSGYAYFGERTPDGYLNYYHLNYLFQPALLKRAAPVTVVFESPVAWRVEAQPRLTSVSTHAGARSYRATLPKPSQLAVLFAPRDTFEVFTVSGELATLLPHEDDAHAPRVQRIEGRLYAPLEWFLQPRLLYDEAAFRSRGSFDEAVQSLQQRIEQHLRRSPVITVRGAQVELRQGSHTLRLQIGSAHAVWNGQKLALGAPVRKRGDSIYLPLRAAVYLYCAFNADSHAPPPQIPKRMDDLSIQYGSNLQEVVVSRKAIQ